MLSSSTLNLLLGVHSPEPVAQPKLSFSPHSSPLYLSSLTISFQKSRHLPQTYNSWGQKIITEIGAAKLRENKQQQNQQPVDGKWVRVGNEIRFWDVQEKIADILIKRMINCLDCGFCMVECFPCRQFDRTTKRLRIVGCIQCGKCLRLKFCMGWRHRFWRRVIVED